MRLSRNPQGRQKYLRPESAPYESLCPQDQKTPLRDLSVQKRAGLRQKLRTARNEILVNLDQLRNHQKPTQASQNQPGQTLLRSQPLAQPGSSLDLHLKAAKKNLDTPKRQVQDEGDDL